MAAQDTSYHPHPALINGSSVLEIVPRATNTWDDGLENLLKIKQIASYTTSDVSPASSSSGVSSLSPDAADYASIDWASQSYNVRNSYPTSHDLYNGGVGSDGGDCKEVHPQVRVSSAAAWGGVNIPQPYAVDTKPAAACTYGYKLAAEENQNVSMPYYSIGQPTGYGSTAMQYPPSSWPSSLSSLPSSSSSAAAAAALYSPYWSAERLSAYYAAPASFDGAVLAAQSPVENEHLAALPNVESVLSRLPRGAKHERVMTTGSTYPTPKLEDVMSHGSTLEQTKYKNVMTSRNVYKAPSLQSRDANDHKGSDPTQSPSTYQTGLAKHDASGVPYSQQRRQETPAQIQVHSEGSTGTSSKIKTNVELSNDYNTLVPDISAGVVNQPPSVSPGAVKHSSTLSSQAANHPEHSTDRTVDHISSFASSSSSSTAATESTGILRDPSTPAFHVIIAKALLSSPSGKLVLADIYAYALKHYPHFATAKRAWKNSIRHSLSVNNCFNKNERAPNGRGYYWGIHPAVIEDFRRGDVNRRFVRQRIKRKTRADDMTSRLAAAAASQAATAAARAAFVSGISTGQTTFEPTLYYSLDASCQSLADISGLSGNSICPQIYSRIQ